MKKLLWKLLEMIDDNHGYSTPLQKRFEIGDKVRISLNKEDSTTYITGETVTIIETGRHDYLVRNSKGVQHCVYQYELMK
jgi:hypothetical protein